MPLNLPLAWAKAKVGLMQNNIKLCAITGGIGSGKSTATEILKGAGYNTISCDEIVRSMYEKRAVLRAIKKVFPTAVSGKIRLKVDKIDIARTVFCDHDKYLALAELITKPAMEIALKKAKKLKGITFIEVPLLYEFNYEHKFDAVLVITRPLQDRIDCVLSRPNMNKEQFDLRASCQIDYDNFCFDHAVKNSTVIVNDGTINALKEKVLAFAKGL